MGVWKKVHFLLKPEQADVPAGDSELMEYRFLCQVETCSTVTRVDELRGWRSIYLHTSK